jgi:hypothetical protein
MYLLGKAVWGRIGGTLSAVLYLLAPYHALDIYVRGDVAEFGRMRLFRLFSTDYYNYIKQKNGSM